MAWGINMKKLKYKEAIMLVQILILSTSFLVLLAYIQTQDDVIEISLQEASNLKSDADNLYTYTKMDKDSDRIQDRLEALIIKSMWTNETVFLPVVVTLYNSVSPQDLEHFTKLGGNVTFIYRYVAHGFAGVLPASNISVFATLEGEKLSMIEYDMPIEYHLDVSVPLIRARPIIWDTYGYMGSPNQSIAILDTGLDDSHPDLGPFQNLNFSSKIVGWYDATEDNASTPEDYGEHGTHVAGIAAGTGAANQLQGSGDVQTTFAYRLPQAGFGYIDYIDIKNPGLIRLELTWDGSNTVLLRLYDPEGNKVAEISGDVPPLTLTYNTEGTAYPTGRYKVLVGNLAGPSGTPFSCLETYPYEGLNDGYNLFSGVAPNSRLVGVKVFDNTGSGTLSTLIKAMDWIIQNRKTYRIIVASMSLGLKDGATDSTLDQKADALVENGIVTVVSAGNGYPDYTIGSPGTAAYVITVGATNDQNGLTSYSSNGDSSKNEYGLIKPDVVAPGGTFDPAYGNRIISTDSNDVDALYSGFPDQNQDDYQQMAGTSMSAPHVSGLSALIIQALGSWNWTLEEAFKVKMLISMTAFEVQSGEGTNVPPLNRGEKDNKEGYGRVNVDAAIEAAILNYTIGDKVNDTFGSGPSDKKVWARQVYLLRKNEYTFNLSVPAGADYDLYLYSGTPDSYGQPVILAKSVNASPGANEIIKFTPNSTGTHYISAKWVSGDGTFNLSSTVSPIHDIAIVNVTVSDTEVYINQIVSINVTVHNDGGVAESFNVTVLYNDTIIETRSVLNLSAGTSETLVFSWNTSGVQPCSNYTIKAEAGQVLGEIDTADNIYIDGFVKVKMEGDVNGDGAVNILDLSIVSQAFGTFEGEPDYNGNADLNEDGVIDLTDLVIVAIHFGETCP
jgi:subtilisin family serine protease